MFGLLFVVVLITPASECSVHDEFETGGFAKSFKEPTRLNDLLSLTDLVAGIMHDILQSEFKGKPTNGGKEKIEVMNWISRPSRFLSKLFLVFSEADDKAMLCKRVEITPKITAPD
ncbi:hypothetical protein WK11_03105 [Burkholderia ubonensis]|uniref:hypothetical protein n=1 Tax=Burkholderia ubonensis TaxID=101571 RepID=UPI00075C152C|nr:hypothetical protein [Burkholderia ubonensis]KVR11949.1 hypothetical protein WK11_03105 [Burkholderia ubonensis]